MLIAKSNFSFPDAIDAFNPSLFAGMTDEFFFQTLFDAWQCNALTAGYMQKALTGLTQDMTQIETEDLAPSGYKVIWDRYVDPTLLLLSLTILPTKTNRQKR